MTKIVIFGANGMLGRYVHQVLSHKDVIPLTRNDLDIQNTNIFDLNDLFKKYSCDNNTVIINCAGVIPQRTSPGDDRDKFIRINAEFPHLVAALAQRHSCKFIHITTDCVFNGSKGNYCETDDHDETGIYGLSKSIGEPAPCTIIRTSIIGEELTNKKSLLEWVLSQNDGTINGYDNHIWNGVTCLQLARIILQMVNENIFWLGVRHIFSPRAVTKYELVKMIVETYKLNITVIHCQTERCDKTLNTIYGTIFDIPDIKTQIAELFLYIQ